MSFPKTPWHLWVVAIIAVLWNAMGATDFAMTMSHNAAWTKAMTTDQLHYVDSFPGWAIAAWGLATWGALIASFLLLLRRGIAVPVFAVSAIAVAVTFTYEYALSDGLRIMGGGKALAFSAVIFVIAVLLWMYSRAMRRRGVLR
ncbi:MAG TPA: hypothetical protein VHD32_05820 [Candidatus Didemnitutus sp.]|nr:hypothetical protein [Candidatus Didemnitutus sp.]